MEEKRVCPHCGTKLQPWQSGCPVCQTHVELPEKAAAPAPAPSASPVPFNSPQRNAPAIIGVVIGIVIIIMGFITMNMSVSSLYIHAEEYDVPSKEFGGDFYTDIYGASDVIVDELNDINHNMDQLSDNIADITQQSYAPMGMLIIAIGLGVMALSITHIKMDDK